ncbi:hypothetical protein HYX14_01530 [Candidatus Woesearchaeota archaeon]|nr:hypothetical protein [Candidatus Woesearchaeota archaeon]
MLQLFSTPGWFNGWDLMFDGVALLIALLIAGYSWRIYKINQENRYAYFTLAFVFVAISLALKLLTSGILYYTPVRDVAAGVLRPSLGAGFKWANIYYRASFFLQMAPMLGAWLLIFLISQKARERLRKFHEVTQIALFVYLVLLISVVSNFNYSVFYVTNGVLLGLITLNYYKNYLNNENKNTFRIMLSFLLITFANLFLVFVFASEWFYFFGEVFLLLGFLMLLQTYRRVVRS